MTEASVVEPNRIAVLDAGSQYGGLIDRNIRELGYRTSLLPLDTPIGQLAAFNAIVISGGPKSVGDDDAYFCDPALATLDKPILGICYGMQLLAKMYGGSVGPSSLREDGPQVTHFSADSQLFAGLTGPQNVLMSHGDSVQKVPEGFVVSGGTNEPLISAIENPALKRYGVQFHPEVFQTEHGTQIFKNFLSGVCELTADYSLDDQEAEAIEYIRKAVGDKQVVSFVSGGVDSAVVAALLAKALPVEQVHAFHVDTGLMRQGESEQVIAALADASMEVTLLSKADTFYNATTTIDGVETPPLNAAIDPQAKRKIIGDTFIKVREQILSDYHLDADSILAQGSLRPDLIESGSHLASTKADVIKTHHNDTQLVRDLRDLGQVVEPLQQLYKDQVRALGRRLGLPESLVERHPFPGPGLGIRILCTEAPYRLPGHETLQAQLDTYMAKKFPDFTADLLPVRTVGVQGDGRSYKYLCGVSGPGDWQQLRKLAAAIPNNNHSVNRVCYVFGDVNRDTMSATATHLTPDVIAQTQAADAIVTDILREYDLMGEISQMPVVLFPADFGESGAWSIALRPFKTPDFMTGLAAIPGQDLPVVAVLKMAERIRAEVPGIARVVYDLTSKPPGTTEWE